MAVPEPYTGHANGLAAGITDTAAPDVEDWAQPVDIMRDLCAPPFTDEDLPPAFAEYPIAFAKAAGFDVGMAMSAALGVAAAALADRFHIVGDSNSEWFQEPRLWILHVARPGCGKTPVQKAMLAPLWELQRRLREEHAKTVAARPEDDDTPIPPEPKLIVGDTTIEALSEVLKDNPRGVIVANDEFESWLGSLDAYRRGAVSKDRGEWLRAFDGGPHTIERVTRGSVYVPNWGASIMTATTPSALRKATRELPEDGLLQRFIPILGTARTEPTRTEGFDGPRQAYAELIGRLFDASPRAHKGYVPLSLEAKLYLREWLKQTSRTAEAFGTIEPALESHFAKYPAFILRIALTLHAAQIVMNESELARDPAAFPVPIETMQAAARFLKRASLHAVTLYLGRDGSEIQALARDVGKAIIAHKWPMVARRDLIARVRAFRNAEPQAQDTVLRYLVDLAWLRPLDSAYVKLTPVRYEVNPVLAAKFAALADRERERRAAIRGMIKDAAQRADSDDL